MWHLILLVLHWSLTVAAVVTGFASARLWYKSAQVSNDPFMGGVQSGDELTAQGQWIYALMQDAMDAAKLNRRAALMTAWSVGLSALATVLSP